MAINTIHKLNVRSPYYINVVNASDLDQDDIEVDPVEPVSTLTAIECGRSQSVGIDVGIHKYEFTTLRKELGDYTITFTGLKVPIKYRIGIRGNMPASFTTSGGWSTYETQWEAATGESVTLTSPSSAVNGVTETATYTSTQADIDTYGTVLELEIQQPIPTIDGYSIGLSCPAEKTQSEVTFGAKVLVLHFYNQSIESNVANPSNRDHKLNGSSADWLTLPDVGRYKTYIFADHFDNDLTPTVPSLRLYRNYSGHSIDFDSDLNDVVYRPCTDLNSIQNTFEFNLQTGSDFGRVGSMDVFISTHRIENTVVGAVTNKTFAVSEWSLASLEHIAQAQNLATGTGDHIKWTYTVTRRETVDATSIDNLAHVKYAIKTFFQNNQSVLTDQSFDLPIHAD